MAKIPVHEVRRIILPLETAVDAVLELDREHGGRLAFGTLVDAHIESASDPGLVIEVIRPGGIDSEKRKYTLPAIAAAFINYCWKSRIPLPRQAKKRIDIVPEGFALTIEGTFDVVRRHGALPKAGAKVPGGSAAVEAGEDGDVPAGADAVTAAAVEDSDAGAVAAPDAATPVGESPVDAAASNEL
jgi:hypothetical protein